MPNGITQVGNCVLVKLPIVIADIPGSVNVDNVTCLDEQAKKVDHIDVVIRDLEADAVFSGPHGTRAVPCPPKATKHFGEPCPPGPSTIRSINVHGTVHKQIYFVNRDDDVRHMAEDVPFTKNIHLRPPLEVENPNNISIDFRDVDVNADFQLPRATRIQQNITINFVLKVTEDQQIWIQTCPPPETIPGRELVANAGLEDWINATTPAIWSASNVARSDAAHSGQFAALLGSNVTNPAALSQRLDPTVVRPGLQYTLCFWARIFTPQTIGGTPNFALTAQLAFYDEAGNRIGTAPVNVAGLTTNYVQFCSNATTPPNGTSFAQVEFSFQPGPNNNSGVLIDDVSVKASGTPAV